MEKNELTELQAIREEIQLLQSQIKEQIQAEERQISLYLKINKIMEAVGYIKKDKKNTFHGYEYASEEAIKKAIQKELVKNKVVFLVTNTKLLDRTLTKTDRGKESFISRLQVNYSLIDCETGGAINGIFESDGNDPQDKGIYKALTGAIKYILTSNFLIPTGLDPEIDEGTDQGKGQAKSTNKPTSQGKAKPAGNQGQTKSSGSKGDSGNKPWVTEEQYKSLKEKIPTLNSKQLDATIAWVKAHRLKNVEKFDIDKLITERLTELANSQDVNQVSDAKIVESNTKTEQNGTK